jgi:DNA-binding Lrp family transcriptional regulator
LKILSALQLDGRASITTLAGQLGLSRATVQARLEYLKSSGVIRRFTIDVDNAVVQDRISAVMLVEVQGTRTSVVQRAMLILPEIISLHSTNGAWDLVAQIETSSLPEFDRVLRVVREISGVINSETCLLLDRARAD